MNKQEFYEAFYFDMRNQINTWSELDKDNVYLATLAGAVMAYDEIHRLVSEDDEKPQE